jgi:hypothetical protein
MKLFIQACGQALWCCVAVVVALWGTAAAAATPCTADEEECMRSVALAGSSRGLVYSTYSLDERNESVTRALIVVHGAGRNADNYFRSAVAAAFLANALDNTIVISPRFASNGTTCKDSLAAGEVNWTCSGNVWRIGGAATGNDALTSFDFADELLRKLARRNVFPNLKQIVFAGHSAGGQFVSRYVMANQVHEQLGVPVSYVIANPSSYAYFDANRPSAAGGVQAFSDAANCTNYDRWPYGMQQRTGYVARLSEDQLQKQLLARPATYMVGELDTLPIAGFDSSCPAMAQGQHRLARGKAYTDYIKQNYGANPAFMIIPLCGHNARCMFTADNALPVLFPKQ